RALGTRAKGPLDSNHIIRLMRIGSLVFGSWYLVFSIWLKPLRVSGHEFTRAMRKQENCGFSRCWPGPKRGCGNYVYNKNDVIPSRFSGEGPCVLPWSFMELKEHKVPRAKPSG